MIFNGALARCACNDWPVDDQRLHKTTKMKLPILLFLSVGIASPQPQQITGENPLSSLSSQLCFSQLLSGQKFILIVLLWQIPWRQHSKVPPIRAQYLDASQPMRVHSAN